jgi:hypothetical protein
MFKKVKRYTEILLKVALITITHNLSLVEGKVKHPNKTTELPNSLFDKV